MQKQLQLPSFEVPKRAKPRTATQKTWKPQFTRGEVNKAGNIFRDGSGTRDELFWAAEKLGKWRAIHNYPINTFQATLRKRFQSFDRNALVAQRLKRIPSIVKKLRHFPDMELARMQDIGGLRAVVSTLKQLEALHKNYKEVLFQHELVSERDYLSKPKQSGYRSIHLVYRYKNAAAPNYDGAEVLHQLVTGSTYQHLPFIQYWVLAAFAEAASLCDGNVAIGLLQQELISTDQLRAAFTRVRLPDVPEIQELFVAAQPKVLTLVSGR